MKKDYTDITIILDRSGSMASVADDTIGGFNTFLEKQKEAAGTVHLTLRQFDDKHDIVYSAPLASAPALNRKTFHPRGSTALLDAIGKAIDDTGKRFDAMPEAERPETVIIAIITDGLENASHIYTRAQVFKMITHQRDAYNWQFTFIGADQDAIAEAGAIGIPATAALNYAKSRAGVANTFMAFDQSVKRQRVNSGGARGMSMSYTVDEQESAMADDDTAAAPPSEQK